ncbi:MAG: SDR family oxidoreductase [Croceibacterium sp.]
MGMLNGQVALVTGAGRGFGRVIAERLAAEGARVAVLSRTLGQIEDVAAAICGAGFEATAVAGDVTDPGSVDRAISQVENQFGGVDLLVSNAGVPGPFGPIWEVDPDAWWQAQAVHIRAPMLLLRRVLPGMIKRGRGRAVCVSAKAARIVAPYMSAYCTGKIAQNRVVAEAAAELAGTPLAVFAIDPGFVFTALAGETLGDPAAQKYLAPMMGRLREKQHEAPDDLARCAQRVVDLASGRYDALSGGYFELPDDLDALLAEKASVFE